MSAVLFVKRSRVSCESMVESSEQPAFRPVSQTAKSRALGETETMAKQMTARVMTIFNKVCDLSILSILVDRRAVFNVGSGE